MFQAVVEAYQEQEDSRRRPALRSRARGRHHERRAEGREAHLAQGRAAGEHLPHPQQRPLPLRRRGRARAGCSALPHPAQLAGRCRPVRRPRHAPHAGWQKKLGYVILPVVIPAGMEPHEALNDNKIYKVVWQVLQALRSHDDRFDAIINKLDLIGKDPRKMEVIAITDKIQKKAQKTTGATTRTDRPRATSPSATPEPGTPKRSRRELAVRRRRARTRPLRQDRQEVRQPQPLGGLGERHRQDRQHPHHPHHRRSSRTRRTRRRSRRSTPSPRSCATT